jgi:transposase
MSSAGRAGSSSGCVTMAAMSWQRPNIGSRMNREVHVRVWERAEVKFLRATRHSRQGRTSRKSGHVRYAAKSGSRFRALAAPRSTVVVDAMAVGIPNEHRVLNGIFWVLHSGAPWRDLPESYGPYTIDARDCADIHVVLRSAQDVDCRASQPWQSPVMTTQYVKIAARRDAGRSQRAPQPAVAPRSDRKPISSRR